MIAACAGGEFTAKGKTVKHPGWKALEDAYRAKMKDAEPKKEGAEKALPELTEGQTLSVVEMCIRDRENPQFSSNPLSRWQQKQSIKKQYAVAKRTGQTAGNTAQARCV